ncbi:hypothetical protein H0H93_002298, partial [Arthromyces matolae]
MDEADLRASHFFSPHRRSRYQTHFGPLNSRTLIANHTFIFIDAPSLVEEDEERVNTGLSYADWSRTGGPIELVKTMAQEYRRHPVVLMSHIPLARNSLECGPFREKGTIRPGAGLGYQNTLSGDSTAGDDHDYCENHHPIADRQGSTTIREVSVKSLSMAMGIKRPGFQLLSLAAFDQEAVQESQQKTFADVPCVLPDQISIYLTAYIPLLLFSLLVVLAINAYRVHKHRHRGRRRLSSPRPRKISDSEDRSDEVELLPQPVSARAGASQRKSRAPPLSSSIFSCQLRNLNVCSGLLRKCPVFCHTRTTLDSGGLWIGFVRDARDIA